MDELFLFIVIKFISSGLVELFVLILWGIWVAKSGVRCCICFNARLITFRYPLDAFDVALKTLELFSESDPLLFPRPSQEKLKLGFLEDLAQKLANFETFFYHKERFVGEKTSYPDFSLCEVLIELIKLKPRCLKNHPELQAYLWCFENLPALKDYTASKEFMTRLFNGADALCRTSSDVASLRYLCRPTSFWPCFNPTWCFHDTATAKLQKEPQVLTKKLYVIAQGVDNSDASIMAVTFSESPDGSGGPCKRAQISDGSVEGYCWWKSAWSPVCIA